MQLVNARDVKNVPGRPKTDKLDAVWLAKLTEQGPAAAVVRAAGRDPATARLHPTARDLTRDRTRYWQRLEKLLEDALIKVSSVASTMVTLSTRDMIEALIAGRARPLPTGRVGPREDESQAPELIDALTAASMSITPS